MNCRLLQNENTFLSLQLKECLDTIEDLKESLKKYELEDDKDEDDSYTYESVIQDNLTNLTNPIPLINPEIKILRDNIMTPLKEHIKEKRPTLSDSSVNTYTSILKSLYRKAFGEGNMDFDDFEKSDVILEFLKDLEPNKRKTIMSALVVICKDPKPYRVQMLDDIKETSANTAKQEKTPEQEEHWITQDALRAKFAELGQDSAHTYKKKTLAMADLQKIQDFIIIALFHLIAPRRAQDYTEFKIKDVDKEKDNWFDERTSELVFTKYKTAKFYGIQRVPISKELMKILKKWIKQNSSEYLLFDTNGSKLSTVKLNQRLNRIFGSDKGCSVNALRHSFLSDKYQATIKLNEDMAEDMKLMGSSAAQSTTYINKE
jgi:integrase